jgi:hypothetical protein
LVIKTACVNTFTVRTPTGLLAVYFIVGDSPSYTAFPAFPVKYVEEGV